MMENDKTKNEYIDIIQTDQGKVTYRLKNNMILYLQQVVAAPNSDNVCLILYDALHKIYNSAPKIATGKSLGRLIAAAGQKPQYARRVANLVLGRRSKKCRDDTYKIIQQGINNLASSVNEICNDNLIEKEAKQRDILIPPPPPQRKKSNRKRKRNEKQVEENNNAPKRAQQNHVVVSRANNTRVDFQLEFTKLEGASLELGAELSWTPVMYVLCALPDHFSPLMENAFDQLYQTTFCVCRISALQRKVKQAQLGYPDNLVCVASIPTITAEAKLKGALSLTYGRARLKESKWRKLSIKEIEIVLQLVSDIHPSDIERMGSIYN
jgi:hypothetical protein